MPWVYTRWIVACVANKHAFGDFTIKQNKRNSMCRYWSAIKINRPIPFWAFSASPNNALVRKTWQRLNIFSELFVGLFAYPFVQVWQIGVPNKKVGWFKKIFHSANQSKNQNGINTNPNPKIIKLIINDFIISFINFKILAIVCFIF